MEKDAAPEPPAKKKTKKWIGGEVPIDLYDALAEIAQEDEVPLTIVYRWALRDFVAARKSTS